MALMSALLIGGFLFLGFLFLLFQRRRPKNFPPGPMPWPIIGNLHLAGVECHKTFIKLGKKYGPIFAFDFGSYRSVVLTEIKLIRECLDNPLCSGRPKFRFFLERTGDPNATNARGIATADGPGWLEQRRFMIRNMRDFGFGKSSLEGIIHDQVVECVASFKKDVGKSISIKGRFTVAVLNTLWGIISGVRTSQNDADLQILLDIVQRAISSTDILVMFFPTLTKLFPNWTGYKNLNDHIAPLDDLIRKTYDKHVISNVPGQPHDVMDTMVEEIKATTDPTSTFYGEEAVKNITKSMADLFIGGSETTTTTLEWFCLIMILNPDVQEKLADEVFRVMGKTGEAKLSERPKMPYAECVVLETLRRTTTLPFGVYHNAMDDVKLGNYLIPKDTVIVPNLYAVHHSEEIWGDPDVFRPERFMNPDGTVNRNHDCLIVFAPGRRYCIGEKLVKDEIFLFITSLLQQFKLTVNPNLPKPSMTSRMSLVLYPAPFELMVEKRH